MKIQFLGHASFLMTTASGTRLVTDPVDPEGYPDNLNYRAFNEPADIVTVSHDHGDHVGTHVVKGSPLVIKGNGKFAAEDFEFLGVETFHDKDRGSRRGGNTVFVMRVDGLTLAHMGDLGHVLTADQAAEVGAVDVAMIPVGGHFTIDAAEATKVAEQVAAKIVIPMHYRTEKCLFPIADVDEFLEGKHNVKPMNDSVLTVTPETLPEEPQIVVLRYSL